MQLDIKLNCAEVDWGKIASSLKKVGMACFDPEVHQRAFESSHTVVFVYENSELIGFGRAVSDGEYQGAVYDLAVLPEAQGRGIGGITMKKIQERIPRCNLILYATPGMEGFYRKLGFRSMKSGMAIFRNPKTRKRFTE